MNPLLLSVLITIAADAYPLTPVPFQNVKIQDSFWSPRIATNRTATVEANLRQCEITGRIKNFAIAGKLEQGKHEGALYNDSDLYKVIEGIAYTLASQRDPDLEKRTDAIIDKIAAAQQPDGYLNTFFTLVKPQERWKNIAHGHELYCAGHLIEAAVAYKNATGKRKLLDVAIKFADHICDTFNFKNKIDASGHEEIELALVKLYRETGDKKYLDQAKFFLDVRGRKDLRKLFGEYAQDHKPVREQFAVTGHAVRAMYLYSAMADVAALTGDKALFDAITKIWHDVVDRKMYITGGIGPSAHNEGFTVPYDLPNDTAYAETCAAIGMALWNHRMFLMTGDGKYADILEREVYNGLLSGVSLSGDKFFYTNPLGSNGGHQRVPWFDCSCCPTNIVRYVPGMGERAYAVKGNGLWTVLYMGNTAPVRLDGGEVKVVEETNYPWDGSVKFTLTPDKPFQFDLHLRRPEWVYAEPVKIHRLPPRPGGNMLRFQAALENPFRITVNGVPTDGVLDLEKGYVTLSRIWKPGDVVELTMLMMPRHCYADYRVKADDGRAAIMRGPVVYCLESVDNAGPVRNIVMPERGNLTAQFEKNLMGGITTIIGEGLAVTTDADGKRAAKPVKFKAIPYSCWANRAPGQMVVWLPESPDLAEIPGEDGVKSNGVFIRASHCFANDKLEALNDGQVPKASNDHSIPRMTWWDRRGTTEWVSYRFATPQAVRSASVYWFDDTGRGACRIPAEWRLLYLDGSDWKPVKLTNDSKFAASAERFNEVTFEPVTTKELKLEAKLQPNYSGGILEWRVK